MGARWYDAQLGRWISADTIVPNPTNSQSLNRFAYVYNNPLKYIDPTGHRACLDWDGDGRCINWENTTTGETGLEALEQRIEERYGVSVEGTWTYQELYVLKLAFGDLEYGLGGLEYARYALNGVTIYRVHGHGNPQTTKVGSEMRLYNGTFDFGTNSARFSILHETFHVYEGSYGGLNDRTESHMKATEGYIDIVYNADSDGRETQTQVYHVGDGWFSKLAPTADEEDAAETWAGYMFRGNWDVLIASDDEPVFARIEPGGRRMGWMEDEVRRIQLEVDASE